MGVGWKIVYGLDSLKWFKIVLLVKEVETTKGEWNKLKIKKKTFFKYLIKKIKKGNEKLNIMPG